MTPREYYRERAGAAARDLELAWTAATLTGQALAGTLKPLETILAQRDGPKRRSSREEQRQMFHYLSERYRIPLKVVH